MTTNILLALFYLYPTVLTANAVKRSWERDFAEHFSSRIQEIHRETHQTSIELTNLPSIPMDDQGGTGGFYLNHQQPSPKFGEEYSITIDWKKKRMVDTLSLVPARRYSSTGLDSCFGTPEEFSVELLDDHGHPYIKVAHELLTNSRNGQPYTYQLENSCAATGIKITAHRLRGYDNGTTFIHAWAEIFAFENQINICHDSEVQFNGGTPAHATWLWKPEHLTDEQTPLGLPELPDQHRNIGWISNPHNRAQDPIALTVDLGQEQEFDSIRFYPADKPTGDLPSGFGFPKNICISICGETSTPTQTQWTPIFQKRLSNPGHNPVSIPLTGTKARYIQVTSNELWKQIESYPAFMALSEIEVLNKAKNIIQNKSFRSSDSMLNVIGPSGSYWSSNALTDGNGPNGKLIPTKEWLILLKKRYTLERRLSDLASEESTIILAWQRGLFLTSTVFAGLGVICLIILPIRYRLKHKHQLAAVRDRIASDLHDEVGSNLGSIQMFTDLAQSRFGDSRELKSIQRIAAETVSAVRDIVWLLRPNSENRIQVIEHLHETTSIMLEALKWKFIACDASYEMHLPEDKSRHLFLYFREALHNILRHSQATHATITIACTTEIFSVVIEDDGVGIPPNKLAKTSTLRALKQRSDSLQASFNIQTEEGKGTTLNLKFPIRDIKPFLISRFNKPKSIN